MSVDRVYLVIKGDRRVRAVRRLRDLHVDEVAIAINLRWPAGWGRVVQTIDVDVPGIPTADKPLIAPDEAAGDG